jgi:hypothetical protein
MTQKRSRQRTPKVTLADLTERVEALERERLALAVSPRWWVDHSGRFQNDPAFDELVRLGRQQRNAERPNASGLARWI